MRPWIKRADVNLREYLGLPEYANVLTKMFGASCPQDARCQSSPSCGCSLTAKCHAYRNASLSSTHADAALANLEKHRAFGLQEAFNSSVLLAARAFAVTVGEADFAPERPSASLVQRCSPARVMRNDPDACRAAFRGHAWDAVVFERAHRAFCARLDAAGLRDHPAVAPELHGADLCAATDHSNPDHVCGKLETPAHLARLAALRAPCRKDGAWWLAKHGFFAKKAR